MYCTISRYFYQLPISAFHDCNGGCDGCVNLNNPSNAGLAGIIQELDKQYNAGGFSISKADFWALMGVAAIGAGVDNANEPSFDASAAAVFGGTGRVDCAAQRADNFDFPSPEMNRAAMMSWFSGRFNFSPDDVSIIFEAGQFFTNFILGCRPFGCSFPWPGETSKQWLCWPLDPR